MDNFISAQTGNDNKPKVAKSGKSFETIKVSGKILVISSDHNLRRVNKNHWYLVGLILQSSRQTRTYHVYKDGDTFSTIHDSAPRVFISNIFGCKLRRHVDGTIEAFYPEYGSIFSQPNMSHVTLKADSFDKLLDLICMHRYTNFRGMKIKQTTETEDSIRLEFKKANFMKEHSIDGEKS